MAVYLNTNKNLENYKELYNEEYFVDKSKIISLINKKINTRSKYLLKSLFLYLTNGIIYLIEIYI